MGGVDIVVDLVEAGEFDAMVPQQAKKLPPKEEFAELLNFHPVLVLLENSTAHMSKVINWMMSIKAILD